MLNYFKKLSQVNIDKENLIIINFDGRMGNQMFQWAFARAYQAKNGIMPIFDDSLETLKLQPFNLLKTLKVVPKPFFNKFLRKTIPLRKLRNKLTEIKYTLPTTQEANFCTFEEKLLSIQAPAYIRGFFQTEKYFSNIRQELLEDFRLIKPLNKKNKEILEQINNTNSISVHFRRGDYLKARVANIFGACSEEYYQKGIDEIASKLDKKPTIFVFSDDINWVKENITFKYDTVYVDANSGKQGFFDLELMKNCKHNIIANSSFSWWGAWLNENPDKIVIAPTPWLDNKDNNDLIPEDWIKIEKNQSKS